MEWHFQECSISPSLALSYKHTCWRKVRCQIPPISPTTWLPPLSAGQKVAFFTLHWSTFNAGPQEEKPTDLKAPVTSWKCCKQLQETLSLMEAQMKPFWHISHSCSSAQVLLPAVCLVPPPNDGGHHWLIHRCARGTTKSYLTKPAVVLQGLMKVIQDRGVGRPCLQCLAAVSHDD